MCFGAPLLRIRGNDWRPAVMCFDFGVLKRTRPFVLNQPTGTSEPFEAEGTLLRVPIFY